jgi:hypothetical protein|tara:strand:+ start:363 stop:1022 length:660 start_codon:yes stop_codon:yes gene_type:complete
MLNNNIKKILKLFIPEILLIIKRKILNQSNVSEELFRGYSQLFKNNLNSQTIYGEYGCGQSTSYVLSNFNIPVYSVDSSRQWVDKIKTKNENNHNLSINYVNIGNVSEDSWGRPDDYSLRDNFLNYANDIWTRELKPNFVLIDGRLRVLCFLITLKNCNLGTQIIFDDYVNRKHYHIVEELIKPSSDDGSQCLFEVADKKNIDMKKLDFLINKFNYILD